MPFDPKPFIATAKRDLGKLSDTRAAFAAIRDAMLREVEAIRTASDRGLPVVP